MIQLLIMRYDNLKNSCSLLLNNSNAVMMIPLCGHVVLYFCKTKPVRQTNLESAPITWSTAMARAGQSLKVLRRSRRSSCWWRSSCSSPVPCRGTGNWGEYFQFDSSPRPGWSNAANAERTDPAPACRTAAASGASARSEPRRSGSSTRWIPSFLESKLRWNVCRQLQWPKGLS